MRYQTPLDTLHKLVLEHGTQRAAAKHLGISQAYFCDMLNGRRDVSGRMLSKLGFRRVVVRAGKD